ncbi:MAG: GNAT family N-acetyltransferase [Shewanella oncorhynchi]
MDKLTLRKYKGTSFDVWGLQALAIAYNEEANKFSALPFCERHVIDCADRMTEADTSAIFLLYDGFTAVGGIWVSYSHAIHTTALMGYENMNFVLPEYRSYGYGKYLAKLGCEWLESKGCKVIQFGVNSGIDSGTDNPYKSLGFAPIGRNFVKLVR